MVEFTAEYRISSSCGIGGEQATPDQLETQEGWSACEREKMASRQAIRNVIRDIFGAVPTSATHGKHAARNGMKELQQTQNGVYLKRYFLDSMDAAARKVCIAAALQRTYAGTYF